MLSRVAQTKSAHCQARTLYARERDRRATSSPALWAFILQDSVAAPATMTSRRIISTDKDLFDKAERTNVSSASEKSNITPAVPT